jgi:hypothetical protein
MVLSPASQLLRGLRDLEEPAYGDQGDPVAKLARQLHSCGESKFPYLKFIQANLAVP